MNKIFAGIGSRQTFPAIESLITSIGEQLAIKGYTLRSGGANGADAASEFGCDKANGAKEIFIPWKGFNKHTSPLYNVSLAALKMAEEYHPCWERLTHGVERLMGRNCYQVLGLNLDDPVDFVVCWTSDGQDSGGTGQALRIARAKGITVYNLFDPEVAKLEWMESL